MQLLDEEAFTVMVCLSVVITSLTSPLIHYIGHPGRRGSAYSRRTVQWAVADADLHVVLCLHHSDQVPTSLALLDSLDPSKHRPISLFPLHLLELTSRASAMLIVTSANTKQTYASNPFGSSDPTATSKAFPSDHIMHAFETYEQNTGGVSIQPLTVVSPYASMHRDIFSVAQESHAALVILPFHKQPTVDGGMEVTNSAICTLNKHVLSFPPCSVGILVDRGLRHQDIRVTILFSGGPDDREAMAIASRMVDHQGIAVTVVRFIAGDGDDEKERQSDDDCIGEFRLRYGEYETVSCIEKEVKNAEETVAVAKTTMVEIACDLCVVGQGGTTLTAEMTELCECPELGLLGDLLASTDFGWTGSVLVVQQYKEKQRNVKAAVSAAVMEAEEVLPEHTVVYDSRRYDNVQDDVYESRRYGQYSGIV